TSPGGRYRARSSASVLIAGSNGSPMWGKRTHHVDGRPSAGRAALPHAGGEPFDAKDERALGASERRVDGADGTDAGEQPREHGLDLELRQVGAEAVVGTDTEGQVRVGVAVDAELVGRVEHPLVPVGRLVEHQDAVASAEVTAVQLVVFGDRASEVQHGR